MNAAQRRLARDPNLRDAIRQAEGSPDGTRQHDISRRTFLKLTGFAGGGLTLGFYLGAPSLARGQETADEFAPNAYLRISTDGSILIYNKNPEVGQGIKTAFPMIVAEELDADWNDVRVEQSVISETLYGRQVAGGSRSIPNSWNELREAGATARAMLVRVAADRWGVPGTECSTADSVVTHDPTGRQLGYGELADAASALPVQDAGVLTLKSRADYRLLGQRITGVDNEKIVTGQPLFGIDTSLPGMVYASYLKCPATGGRVRNANLDEIRALPGVRDAFVIEGNDIVTELMPGVAIIGDSTWATQQARASLRVDWDESEASTDSWSRLSDEARSLSGRAGSEVIRDFGNVDRAFETAEKTLEAFYSYPFVSHAPLEPQNCTAWYRDGRMEIWAPSQTPQRAIQNVANVLGISEDGITLHQTRIRAQAHERLRLRGRGDRPAGRCTGETAVGSGRRHGARLLSPRRVPLAERGAGQRRPVVRVGRSLHYLHPRRPGPGVGRIDAGRRISGGTGRKLPDHPVDAAACHTHGTVARAGGERHRLCGTELSPRACRGRRARPSGVSARDHG